MFSQGSYNPQSGQGPRTPRPPPYIQHLPVPPPHLPHNFQQRPLLPSTQLPPRPAHPCPSMYQHGPLAPHFWQAPPGGMPSTDQPYLHPPPTVHGSAPLPRLYTSAQQNLQHSSYSVPGPPPPPPVLQSPEMLQAPLPPARSHSQTLYRAPIHQLPQQQGVVQGLQHIPPLPPPPSPPTSCFSTSPVSGNTSEASDRNSQISAMAHLPALLPRPPPPIPPSSPPPVSSPTSVSLSLPAGLSAKTIAAPDVPRQLKPTMPTNPLKVATESHSPDDSDMEMEDDITRSDDDQATDKPIEGPNHATGPISSEFDAEKQLYTLTHSVGSTMVLYHDFGSSKLDEQGSKLVSSCDDLTFGGSLLKVQSPVINSAGATESFTNDGVNSSTPLVDDKSSTKAAAAAECVNSDSYSGQAMKGRSPFRLLQDYASNDSSENDEDPCSKDADTETIFVTENLLENTGLNLKMDTGSKIERGFGLLSKSGMPYGVPEFSSDSQREFKETVPTSIANGSTTKLLVIKHENQSSTDHASSPKALPKADVSRGTQENVPFSGKYEKDNGDKPAKLTSNTQKIDKFGRLVREGASDSESDDSLHGRKHNRRGRSQSRSRSRSPLNSRRRRRRSRRRRSPRRRREKRSRSHSWSPGNRRSRSRSPSFRHTGEFSSGNMRREKGHLPDCFDFLRGKCYRGASCRYLHHATEKNDGSRHHRSKQQYVQLTLSSKNFNTVEDNKKLSPKVLDHEQDFMNQEMQHNHDMSASSSGTKKECTVLYKREDSVCDALVDSDIIKSYSLRKFPAKVPEIIVQERSEDVKISVDEKAMESDWPMTVDGFQAKHATDTNILKSPKEASQDVLSSLKDSQIQQSQSVLLDPVLVDADHPAQQSDDSSISDLSPDKTSRTSAKKLHASETLQNSADSPCKPCSAPNMEDNNALHMTHLTSDYNLMPQTAPFQSQSALLESFPSYMLPNQNSLFSVPLNASSASALPPPSLLPPHGPTVNTVLLWPPHRPTVNAGTAQPGVTRQFQQNGLPSRSDFSSQMFSRPYSTELSGYSQVSGLQHRSYPPMQEPHRPSLEVEDLRLKSLPGCNLSSQQLEGTSPFEENHLKQPPLQALGTSDSIRNNNYPQHMAYSHEATASKMQSFSSDNLPPGDILKSSEIYPCSQQRQPPYNLHHPASDSVYVLPGKINSLSRYPPDFQDRNQPSHPPDFGVSKNSTHFNPYASTFEKPLSSRFSSNVFRQEKDSMYSSKHNHPSSLRCASVDGQGVGSIRETSPTSASGVGKIIPRSGGDQYDPLFDSFEPSSNSYKKSDHIHNWKPPSDSDIMLRLKGSNQPLDVEEKNRKKDASGIALATSLDNEEFGETADAEVGDVENGSQSNPNDLADMNVGEMEIDQIKSTGKSMRSKDSRSMKLFKVCLAEFVKEVLKPSWRQGNMSKETFKTVVKKAVDKVSGAMKNHQIPKSKAKINQYIDSSQRKLTKLVMGYVDKYAKR